MTFNGKTATGFNHLIQPIIDDKKEPIHLIIGIPYSDIEQRSISLTFQLDILPYKVKLNIKIPTKEYIEF